MNLEMCVTGNDCYGSGTRAILYPFCQLCEAMPTTKRVPKLLSCNRVNYLNFEKSYTSTLKPGNLRGLVAKRLCEVTWFEQTRTFPSLRNVKSCSFCLWCLPDHSETKLIVGYKVEFWQVQDLHHCSALMLEKLYLWSLPFVLWLRT